MWFYAALFLLCVAFSAVAIRLFRSLAHTHKTAHRTKLPKSRVLRAPRDSNPEPADEVPKPWGWTHAGRSPASGGLDEIAWPRAGPKASSGRMAGSGREGRHLNGGSYRSSPVLALERLSRVVQKLRPKTDPVPDSPNKPWGW
jgi:hypothetical protein